MKTIKPNILLKNLSSKWLGLFILMILFAFLNYNDKTLFFSGDDDKQITLAEDFIAAEFPAVYNRTYSDELPGWTMVTDENGKTLGYYIVAPDNRWNFSGYAGAVPLFIKLDSEKTISEIKLLENNETKRFLFKLYQKDFLSSWKNMTLSEAAAAEVDTVSGVTLTSRAVIANLSEVIMEIENSSSMGGTDYRKIIIRTAEMILILFAAFSFFVSELKKYRVIFLLSTTAVFGFLAGDFISIGTIRGVLTGSVSFYSNPVLWVVFILSVIFPLFTNKAFYCSHLCPFGAAQEVIGKLSPEKKKIPVPLRKIFKYSRPVLFGLTALVIILGYKIDLSLIEPFAAFLFTVAAPLTLILALVSLYFSLSYNKPWCRYFCPTGQLLEYLRSDS